MASKRWADLHALITGASSGIGAAIARELGRQGARLTLTGRRADALEAVAHECSGATTPPALVSGDLTSEAFRETLVSRAHASWGPVALLVNNAGITMNARFEELAPAVLREIFEINFFAAAGLTRLLLPDLRKTAGRILVISSVTGLVGTPTRTAYAASKHALHGLFNALRVELRADRVGVTIVCPGYVATPIRERALLADGSVQGTDQAAGRRMLSAERVATVALEAAWRRRRLVKMGPETRLARFLSLTAPGLLDRILERATR